MTTRLYYYTGTGNSLWVARQLAGRLDKATEQAGRVEQHARDLIIEKGAHAQAKGKDNRDSSGVFLVDVPEHAFLSMEPDCPNGAFTASTR